MSNRVREEEEVLIRAFIDRSKKARYLYKAERGRAFDSNLYRFDDFDVAGHRPFGHTTPAGDQAPGPPAQTRRRSSSRVAVQNDYLQVRSLALESPPVTVAP